MLALLCTSAAAAAAALASWWLWVLRWWLLRGHIQCRRHKGAGNDAGPCTRPQRRAGELARLPNGLQVGLEKDTARTRIAGLRGHPSPRARSSPATAMAQKPTRRQENRPAPRAPDQVSIPAGGWEGSPRGGGVKQQTGGNLAAAPLGVRGWRRGRLGRGSGALAPPRRQLRCVLGCRR